MGNGTLVYVAITDELKMMSLNEAESACACKGEGWRLPYGEEMKLIREHRKELHLSRTSYYRVQGGYYDPGYKNPVRTGGKNQKMKVRCVKEVKQQKN